MKQKLTESYMNNNVGFRTIAPGMGQAVAERTILRKNSNGEYETWGDVATRVAYGNARLYDSDNYPAVNEFKLLQKYISNGSTLMSGRHLQHGDANQKERNQEIYTNCSTAPTSFLSFYFLLNGSGVGRSYDDDLMLVNWDYAPNVRCVLSSDHPDFIHNEHESVRDARHKYGDDSESVLWFIVPDSREGWAKALELWENAAFEKIHSHKMLILDFSKVRGKGSPIGGMQNRPASGPVPLMIAFEKATKLKGAGLAPWKQTMFIDHYFSECVLVGGARRSSRMSTKHWNDPSIFEFINIKRPIEFNGKDVNEVAKYRAKNSVYGFLWTSNNSVVVDDEFWKLLSTSSEEQTPKEKHAHRVFDMVCSCSYGDGTGEPGFINGNKLVRNDEGWGDLNRGDYAGSKKYQLNDDTQIFMSKLAKRAKRKKINMIVNPCVTGETPILTDKGYVEIQNVIGVPVNIWNGTEWSEVVPFSTGKNPIVKVYFSDGSSLRCTPYHKFVLSSGDRVEAQDLAIDDKLMKFSMPTVDYGEDYPIDAYSQGFYSGDGCSDSTSSSVYFPKFCCESRLSGKMSDRTNETKHRWCHGKMFSKNWVPVTGTKEYCLNWLAGICDSDGTVTRDENGNGIQITSIDKDFLLSIKLMLSRIGVRAKVVSGHDARVSKIKGICYNCKTTYRLLIGNADVHHLLSIGFTTTRLSLHNNPPQRDARQFVRVDMIEYENDFEETFCFTEPKNGTGTFNGIVTAQCSEVALSVLGGVCVIGDVVPFFCDTIDEAEDVFRAVTRALIRVNLMESVYDKEVKRTNRIGVGLTGVHEFAYKFFGYGFRDLIDENKSKDFWLTIARFNRAVHEEAEKYSKELGVVVPHTQVCVKPSGSVSKLFLLTEGWHLPSMREFLRWVQFRNDDPLIVKYQNSGYPIRQLVTYKGSTIIGFPTAPMITQLGMGDKLVTASEATPEEQYQWLMLGEKYWIQGTDESGIPVTENYGNQISYTLKYDPTKVTYSNFKKMMMKYQSQVRCCSVMPQEKLVSYEYQPEEPISKEEYDELVSRIKTIKEDVGREHLACENGSCPIDFNEDDK